MRRAFSVLPVAAMLVAATLLASALQAQQPSNELKELRETSQDLWRVGDYAGALQFAERALPLVIREYGPEHEETGIQYFSLGLITQAMGNLAQAERHFTDTVRIREKVYGADSPSVAMALENLGQVQLKSGRIEAAEVLFRRALKIKQDTLGRKHAFTASGHANLGDIGLARGNWAAARASYREAIRLLIRQDTTYEIVKKLVEKEIREFRDTFVGLCRAIWQLRTEPDANKGASIEETFAVAQLAWKTSAASALAKMTARLGTSDTDLGRSIRRVQDNSGRVLALHEEDQKLLADRHAVLKADFDLQRRRRRISRRQHRPGPRPGPGDQAPDRAGGADDGPAGALPAGPKTGRLRYGRTRPSGHRQGTQRTQSADREGVGRDPGRPRADGGGGEGSARLCRVHLAAHSSAS